jgi:tRNA pseudouridine38-40 synthase
VPAVKLTLEYHGGGFRGWAAQPGLRTVEGTLGDAIATVLGSVPSLSVAGRTDTGVHARGQVASFAVEGESPDVARLRRSLNGVLPRDVSVVGVKPAAGGFDARRDARSRTYSYRLLVRTEPSPFERDRALWWPYPLDEEALHACAARVVGTHDFTAFTPAQTEHVRFERDVLAAEWRRSGDVLELWIEADTFMRYMVRVLVGTMLDLASGRRDLEDFSRLLDGAPRSEAGQTAEPHGLCLERVRYQDA